MLFDPFSTDLCAALLLSSEGVVQQAGSGCSVILRTKPSDLVGRPLQAILDPDLKERLNIGLTHVQAGAPSAVVRSRWLHPNGGYDVVLRLEWDGEHVMVLVEDVSHRATIMTSSGMSSLVDFAANSWFVHDMDGCLRDANLYAATSLGYTQEEMLALELADIETTIQPGRMDSVWKNMDLGKPITVNGTHRRKDGTEFPVSVRLALFETGTGEVLMLAICHEVTRFKIIENKLIEARNEAEFANRSKSEFLANMSHELRTPLNAIIGYAELLDEDPVSDEVSEDLARIQRSGRYLLRLIDDVLDLSKVEAGKLKLECKPVEIDLSIEALLPTFNQLIRRNRNSISIDCPAGLRRVHADPTRVRQVLLNLVSNAAKFTNEGNIVVVVQQTSDRTWIDVVDSGLGMNASQISKLFGAFSQVHRTDHEAYGGTGLGLALSRRLCNLMNGDVTVVRSEENVGTTFRIDLPTVASS